MARRRAEKNTPLWRAIIRARAVGETHAKISQDLEVGVRTVDRVLRQPEARAHLAKLLDDMDDALVRSHTMSPWALMLAGGKRRRKAVRTPRDS